MQPGFCPAGQVRHPETGETAEPPTHDWKQTLADHQRPVLRSGVWQIINSIGPYIALWVVMVWSLEISYWLTLGLAFVAAGFLTRIFIIFHDCAHSSFLGSRRANRILEFITGVLTFTPYRQWRYEHALHHATAGDLDRRGRGDVWTMTVQEYLDASTWTRLSYRVVRSPLVLFVIAPLYMFLVYYRFPWISSSRRERRGIVWTNGTLLAVLIVMTLTIGLKAYVLIQLPVMLFAGSVGFWLFYVQHQFEGMTWQRKSDWSFPEAALRGSSFYKLPRPLQWFTGNIGFHHVHHLSPAIPNYNLEKCHNAVPAFQRVKPVTLMSSVKSLSFRLWDESRDRLVGFGRLRVMRRR